MPTWYRALHPIVRRSLGAALCFLALPFALGVIQYVTVGETSLMLRGLMMAGAALVVAGAAWVGVHLFAGKTVDGRE